MSEHDEFAEDLASFRRAKDDFMREDHHSPLEHADRHSFDGLHYFPYNAALRVETALDRNVADDVLTLETSTGDSREYHRVGKIHFEVAGQPADLTIFAAEDGELFVPLRDGTSGRDTYGAGRYLEPENLGEDRVLVDFNYLYNPYCAYNEAYSCPLPPRENWLHVPIEAGEKTYLK